MQLDETGEPSSLSVILDFEVFPRVPRLAVLSSSMAFSIEDLSAQVHEQLHSSHPSAEVSVEMPASHALVEFPSLLTACPSREFVLDSLALFGTPIENVLVDVSPLVESPLDSTSPPLVNVVLDPQLAIDGLLDEDVSKKVLARLRIENLAMVFLSQKGR